MDRQAYTEMAEVEDKLWWYISRRKIIQKILDSFVTKKAANRILEVGCGSGGNLNLLAQYGQLHAVEHDENMRDLAANKQLCQVLPATLPNPLPCEGQFDLICMFDVLEHIDERLESLTMIGKFMKPGGLLAITVPAYMFLWSPHDDAVHHKIRYTLTDLKKLVRAVGYEIRCASYFNFFLFPAIVVFRLLRRWFGKPASTDFDLPNPIMNRLYTAVFGLEKYCLPGLRFPCGLSIIIIAQKPVAN